MSGSTDNDKEQVGGDERRRSSRESEQNAAGGLARGSIDQIRQARRCAVGR